MVKTRESNLERLSFRVMLKEIFTGMILYPRGQRASHIWKISLFYPLSIRIMVLLENYILLMQVVCSDMKVIFRNQYLKMPYQHIWKIWKTFLRNKCNKWSLLLSIVLYSQQRYNCQWVNILCLEYDVIIFAQTHIF